MLEIGQPAPDFELKDVNGNTVKLNSMLRKENLLLVFYRGSWCPLCNMQLANLSKDYDKFKSTNTEIIAISSDDTKGGMQSKEKSNAPFPILLNTNSDVIKSYGILVKKRELKDMPALMHKKKNYAMPSVFIIDKKGIIRYKYIGKTYIDRPSNELLLEVLTSLKTI